MNVGKLSEKETFFRMRKGAGFMMDETEEVFLLWCWLVRL